MNKEKIYIVCENSDIGMCYVSDNSIEDYQIITPSRSHRLRGLKNPDIRIAGEYSEKMKQSFDGVLRHHRGAAAWEKQVKKIFCRDFVVTFCASWCAKHYDSWGCGEHEKLRTPPIEDAVDLAECAWNEYVKSRN